MTGYAIGAVTPLPAGAFNKGQLRGGPYAENETYDVSSGFGEPRSYGTHGGCDIACPHGTHLFPQWDAKVDWAWRDSDGVDENGWMLAFTYPVPLQLDADEPREFALLQHQWYHLAEAPRRYGGSGALLKAGDRIFQGEHVALSGNTGTQVYSGGVKGPFPPGERGAHLHEGTNIAGRRLDPLSIYSSTIEFRYASREDFVTEAVRTWFKQQGRSYTAIRRMGQPTIVALRRP